MPLVSKLDGSPGDEQQARVLGSARFPTAALSDGVTREVGGTASFAAPPPLWDQAGRRMALAEALVTVPQARVPRTYNQRYGICMENAMCIFEHSVAD